MTDWFSIRIAYATVLGFDILMVFTSDSSTWLLASTSVLIETMILLLLLLLLIMSRWESNRVSLPRVAIFRLENRILLRLVVIYKVSTATPAPT